MADKFNYRSGPAQIQRLPIASGTVVEIGELLKISSGKVLKMATSTDNLTFIGVAADAHAATEPSGTIGVYFPHPMTVFEYDLNAATSVVAFDNLQFNADKTLKVSGTDAIATAVESKLTATTVLVAFKIPNVSGAIRFVGDAS